MSEVKVNKISPRTNCGTVTLGDSGDTFTIPAGATITNAGTAGTANTGGGGGGGSGGGPTGGDGAAGGSGIVIIRYRYQ